MRERRAWIGALWMVATIAAFAVEGVLDWGSMKLRGHVHATHATFGAPVVEYEGGVLRLCYLRHRSSRAEIVVATRDGTAWRDEVAHEGRVARVTPALSGGDVFFVTLVEDGHAFMLARRRADGWESERLASTHGRYQLVLVAGEPGARYLLVGGELLGAQTWDALCEEGGGGLASFRPCTAPPALELADFPRALSMGMAMDRRGCPLVAFPGARGEVVVSSSDGTVRLLGVDANSREVGALPFALGDEIAVLTSEDRALGIATPPWSSLVKLPELRVSPGNVLLAAAGSADVAYVVARDLRRDVLVASIRGDDGQVLGTQDYGVLPQWLSPRGIAATPEGPVVAAARRPDAHPMGTIVAALPEGRGLREEIVDWDCRDREDILAILLAVEDARIVSKDWRPSSFVLAGILGILQGAVVARMVGGSARAWIAGTLAGRLGGVLLAEGTEAVMRGRWSSITRVLVLAACCLGVALGQWAAGRRFGLRLVPWVLAWTAGMALGTMHLPAYDLGRRLAVGLLPSLVAGLTVGAATALALPGRRPADDDAL